MIHFIRGTGAPRRCGQGTRRPTSVLSSIERTVLLGLIMGTAACHTWQPTQVSPSAVISVERPESVRLTLVDGRRITMSGPVVRADSIVGSTEAGNLVRAAAGDVSALEVRRVSFTRTVSLVVSQTSFVLAAVALIVHVQPHYRGLF